MNYEYFARLEDGSLTRNEDESEQAFMERILTAVCSEPSGEGDCFNERMRPQFCSCSAENRSLSITFFTEEWMLNPNGTLHGGLSNAAVDIVMSVLTRYLLKRRTTVTVQLNTNFIKVIKRGEPFTVHVTADHAGRRCVITHAHVTAGSSEKPVITATGVLM